MATLTLPSNLNNKVGAEFLVHIMAPAAKKIDSETFNTPFQVEAPGAARTEYVLFDYKKTPLKEVPPNLQLLSHGKMSVPAFRQLIYDTHGILDDDAVGIYYFIRPDQAAPSEPVE